MKKLIGGVVVLLLVWIGSYCGNSVAGGYWLTPTADGKVDTLSVDLPTMVRWQPRFGYHGDDRTSTLGYVYLPLIAIDQFLIHPTIDLAADGGLTRLTDATRAGQLHPEFSSVEDAVPEMLRTE